MMPTQISLLRQVEQDSLERGQGYFATLQQTVDLNGAGYAANGKRPAFQHRYRHNVHPNSGNWPGSLAALEVHRWDTTFGGPNAPYVRKCGKTRWNGAACKAPAVRGSTRCVRHGGRRAIEARLKATYKDYRPIKAMLAMSAIRQAMRMDRYPRELAAGHPGFAELTRRAIHGVTVHDERFMAWSYAERRLHHEACADLTLAFMAAWESAKDRGDFVQWGECVRRLEMLRL